MCLETPSRQEWGGGAKTMSGWAGAAPQHPAVHGVVPGQRRVRPQTSTAPGDSPRQRLRCFHRASVKSGHHSVLLLGLPNPCIPRPALFKGCSQMDGKWTQKHATCSRTLTRKEPPWRAVSRAKPSQPAGGGPDRSPRTWSLCSHTAWPHPAPHGPVCWFAADGPRGDPQLS